jgi:hypothetical protein
MSALFVFRFLDKEIDYLTSEKMDRRRPKTACKYHAQLYLIFL